MILKVGEERLLTQTIMIKLIKVSSPPPPQVHGLSPAKAGFTRSALDMRKTGFCSSGIESFQMGGIGGVIGAEHNWGQNKAITTGNKVIAGGW